MIITVKFFGPQAQLAECSEIEIELGADATATDAMQAVAQACPVLADSIPKSRLAINHEIVTGDCAVIPDAEVALIGMLGGG